MTKKGFTLVEIMVSMIILALLAAGVFSVVISGRYLVSRSERRVVAIEIARSEMEHLRPFVRADTWNNMTNPLFATNDWGAGWDTLTYAPYQVRRRVDTVAGATYRRVTIQVAWNEPRM
jgi:prepilin-type N-terminal cleavage/methylation domain-containing protein